MKRITKKELIDLLSENMQFTKKELEQKSYDELFEYYTELYTGEEILFPNGRDYDAEDEDSI